jgi:hypothetical protein
MADADTRAVLTEAAEQLKKNSLQRPPRSKSTHHACLRHIRRASQAIGLAERRLQRRPISVEDKPLAMELFMETELSMNSLGARLGLSHDDSD